MKILIPNNNIPERKYIIDILLNEFLGLKYNIETKDTKNYEIILENGNKLIIEEHFFSQFPKNLEYLDEKNIPQKVEFGKNEFIVENDIPIIFGKDKCEIKKNEIVCGIDIFASSFFMLSCWEEYVNKTRDKHNRFPAYASLAYKNNFLDRPVVNEYVEMLWNMLRFLGCKQERKKREFKLILTHDIDHISKWDTKTKLFRQLVGDIILRKSIKSFLKTIKNYFAYTQGKLKDPFDTFDYLMDISEQLGIKSYFFFMAEGLSNYDNNYNISSHKVQQIISNIKKRGHKIGIHPTYKAYNNKRQLQKEKNELEQNFNTTISYGREHYLRFEVPTTWQIWEECDMQWDSTLGYADKEGFRCGVCYEYSVFNILTRKKLKLKEKPLIVMDESVIRRKNLSDIEMETIILDLIDKVKRYNGDFVLLWHNSSFHTEFWDRYKKVYTNVLSRSQK